MISIVQLGTVDYATGLRLQQQLVALRKEEKIGDVLLLLEHSPVITLGRNAKAANVVAAPEVLARRGVELFECDRGGDVTFHGRGQIVGYPIFDLRGFAAADGKRKTLGVVEFVRRLEDVLMRTCADFAIATQRVPGLTGVWTCSTTLSSRADSTALSSRAEENDSQNRSPDSRDLAFAGSSENLKVAKQPRHEFESRSQRNAGSLDFAELQKTQFRFARDDNFERDTREGKLAAIGVHVSRSVTSHGFALNVNTDLSYFSLIIPCGITTKPVTSMHRELGRELDLNAVAESISRNFGLVFQSQILWVETLDALLGNSVGVPMKPPAELREMRGEDESSWA